ncbi:MAG: T9SS type A sorting domain-containing protein [Ignavibacteriales bacterium]|nr:T9SS type A sorting domain-containing protein [Ignavibacteriales bacterium]
MAKFTFLLMILFTINNFSQITYDSDFESGNLASIQSSDNINFYITTKADEGIDGGSTRWFYFRMKNVKDKQISLRFINTDVTKAMYSYDNVNFERFNDQETFGSGIFIKKFDQDTVYLAYYTPYNYSYLQSRLNEWKKNQFVTLDTLGFSPKGLPIQEMIITDNTIPHEEKQIIWIHARTHPSETPSSWHFDGIVQELLNNNEVINFYLQKLEFHLIPFTNPDGVFYGRSRINFGGINLEENWNDSDIATCDEVKILRARMKQLNDEKPFSVFLNLHSQAASYCTFWIHSSNSTSILFNRNEFQFCNLNVSDNNYFTKGDYSFSNLQSLFPEGWLWNNYGDQVMALTYETPYDNYFKNSADTLIEVTNENLFELGRRTVYAIAEYLEISHPKHFITDNDAAEVNGTYESYDITNEFYGDNFFVLDESSSANYTTENLPSGKYDVSAWWATSEANSYETKFEITASSNNYEITKTQKLNGGQWNYLTTVELNNEGTLSIKVNGNSTGLAIADAFRLIYVEPITGIEQNKVPDNFTLYQNYPNPFNPVTTIKYSIPANEKSEAHNVKLLIFDILGNEVAVLVNEIQTSGEYKVSFNASNLASGTYFYRLQVGDYSQTKKMLLIK